LHRFRTRERFFQKTDSQMRRRIRKRESGADERLKPATKGQGKGRKATWARSFFQPAVACTSAGNILEIKKGTKSQEDQERRRELADPACKSAKQGEGSIEPVRRGIE